MTRETQSIDLPKAILRDRPQAQARVAVSSRSTISIFAERPAGRITLALIAIALWVLSHPYPGISRDAGIYIARALADLDPNGVGRDIMFIHDGQSRFSLFTPLLDHLVAWFGTGRIGLLLALLAMAAWIAALAAYAERYVTKSLVAIVIIFVAVLPITYGAPDRFTFSEANALPRPFAEALVVLALAMLAGHRLRAGFAVLLAATLIHPLMALAGWGVFAVVLSLEDRRWAAIFAGATLLAIAGAIAGLPLLHRLATVMDPGLRAFAESRSPLLFPHSWSSAYLGLITAQAASLLIAASFVSGRRRLILIAALAVGIIGIAAQMLFGDYLSLILVVQAQVWRMAWLTAAVGAAAFGFCALTFWQQGPKGHLTLAFLSLAWLFNETPDFAGLLAFCALATHFYAQRLPTPLTTSWIWPRALWALVCVVALALNLHHILGYAAFLQTMPAEASGAMGFFWTRRFVAFPILALLLPLAFASQASRHIAAAAVLSAMLLSLTALRFWDDRGPFQKMMDSGEHPAALNASLASRPGEILWVDGLTEAWYLAGRPQWASPQQGVSTIFSPDLAKEWASRIRFLISEGLVERNTLSPLHNPSTADLPRVTAENVAHLCARPDAPAWIIAPTNEATIIPPSLKAHEWRLAQPNFRWTEEPHAYVWHRIDAYAILACARGAPELR